MALQVYILTGLIVLKIFIEVSITRTKWLAIILMCTFNNNPRGHASIDTPLRAYVPYPEVDHTHPDSIIALATMSNGKNIMKKVYGESIGWLDWQRPGFDLGLKMENLISKNNSIIGIILGHHGLFTWGNTSKECYSNSIYLIGKRHKLILITR